MSRPSNIKVGSAAYQSLIRAYETYLLQIGYTAKSAAGAARYVAAFLAWLEQRNLLVLSAIQSEDIVKYQRYLKRRPNQNKRGRLSQKSVYAHLKAVQRMFNYLLEQGQVNSNPATKLKMEYPREKKSRNILSSEQISALYEACQSHQERAILSMAYGCGLRANELESVNVDQVLLQEGLLIVAAGKGNKRRVIPMSSGVVSDLYHYYHRERSSAEPRQTAQLLTSPQSAFMLHSRGGRMRAYTYNKYLQNILQNAVDRGLLSAAILKQGISLHSLRHSIATHLIEQGVSVEQVRLFLGHSQLETTQLYTRVSAAQLEKLVP